MEMEILNKILDKLEQLEQKMEHGLNQLRGEMNVVGIQADIEFIVRENSLINLELDRLKRQVNA